MKGILASPREFLRFPFFLAIQSFLFKISLCILRRLRGKKEGINSFLAGVFSGLSILLIKDQHFRTMLALYLIVRTLKVVMDINESKGNITERQIVNGTLIVGVVICTVFTSIYMIDHTVLQSESQWFNLPWIFGLTNQPNDQNFRDLLRIRLAAA